MESAIQLKSSFNNFVSVLKGRNRATRFCSFFIFKVFLLPYLLFHSNSVFAQNPTISVVDEKSGESVPYAVVVFSQLGSKTTSQISMTDEHGKIACPPFHKYQIKIIHINYLNLVDTLEGCGEYVLKLKENLNELDEYTVTGEHNEGNTRNSVHARTVITKERIAAQAAQNLMNILQTELNIRINQDNATGASSMTMQGISGQNVKILIDGVPVIGRINGSIDLSQINLLNIERIEIIEGPMSAIYGTDALGGVINLITRKSVENKVEAIAKSYYESVGRYNFDVWMGSNYKRANIQLNGGRYFFDGFNPGDAFFFNDTLREKNWKPKEQWFANGQFNYRFKDAILRYTGSYFYEKIISKGPVKITPFQAYAFDEYYYTNRINNVIFFDKKLKKHLSLSSINSYAFFYRIRNAYFKDMVTLNRNLIAEPSEQDTSTFHSWLFRATITESNPVKKYTYQVGYDINLDGGRGQRMGNETRRIDDYAIFGNLEYKPNHRINIRPALRVAYNTRYGAPIVPSLNAKFNLNSNLILRGGYARGFRSPSLKELYFYFVDVNHNITGNLDLRPERSNNYITNLTWFYSGGDKYSLKIAYNFFYNDIKDIIVLAQVDSFTNLNKYVNIDKFKTVGNGLNVEYKSKLLTANTGFAYTGRYNNLTELFGVKPYSFTPEFNLNLIYQIKPIKTYLGLFYKHFGQLTGFAVNADNQVYLTTISAFDMLDLTVSRAFLRDKFRVSTGLKNVFNVTSVTSNANAIVFHQASGNQLPIGTGRFMFFNLAYSLNK